MRFSGRVDEPTIESHAGLSGGRAWLDTFVTFGSRSGMFPLLIDTGSSATTFHPQIGLGLLCGYVRRVILETLQEASEQGGSLPMPEERICGLHTWSPPSVTHLPPRSGGRGDQGWSEDS